MKPVADALAALAGFPAGSFDVIIGSPFSVTDSFAQAEARQWSDEVQLNYDSKYLTLTVGALYFHLNTTNGAPTGEGTTTFFAPFPGGVVPPNQGLNLFYNNAKSLAGYAQAEVHVTPKFDLVGGYRLTRDRKTGTAFADASGLPPAPLSYTKTKPTFLLGFNYKPMQDMLLYAKYSTGFVSGGAVGAVAFEPETVRSWEAGVKTDLLNRRLRVNLALFTAAYKNLQQADQGRNIGHPELGTVVVDQGNAEARGFELELTATPLEGLTVNGGLGYTETKFNHVNPLYGTDETFQPTQRPRWTTNLSGQYETKPLWDETRLLFRIDANWRSRAATDGFLPTPALVGPVAYVPAYWLVNGRVALRDIKVGGGDAEIAFWAKNIFNEDTVQFPIAFNPGPRLSPYLVSTDYIQARTFGVDLIYNF